MESVSRWSTFIPISLFLFVSVYIGVDASPLPRASLSINSASLQLSNTNGQYTPQLYPGQKGYYDPNQDSSSLVTPSSNIANYAMSQSSESSEMPPNYIRYNTQPLSSNDIQPDTQPLSSNDIQPNTQPLSSNDIQPDTQPLSSNQKAAPISGVSPASISGYNSDGLESQALQQPDVRIEKPKNPAVSTQTSNIGANTASNDGGFKHTSNAYRQYDGDGSTNAGWPQKNQWVSFEDMYVIPNSRITIDTMLNPC